MSLAYPIERQREAERRWRRRFEQATRIVRRRHASEAETSTIGCPHCGTSSPRRTGRDEDSALARLTCLSCGYSWAQAA